jgi:UBX domain-containing protein 1
MPIASLDDFKKKEDEDKKATQSYAGGDKSGLAIQNPGDEDQWKKMQEMAMAGGSAGPLPSDHVVVTVYRNGFTVGDGPFRPLSDPLNKKFMDEMAQGRAPAELQAGRSEQVHVAVHDKRGEDYKEPPAPAYVKFSGEGNSLGGSSSSAAAPAVEASQGTIQVDDSKPKTKVQIRFHDGQKKAQEFNQDHTVGDLRAFCQQCVGGQAMAIKGGFPPKPITDDSLTLKDAGLCGAAVNVMPA